MQFQQQSFYDVDPYHLPVTALQQQQQQHQRSPNVRADSFLWKLWSYLKDTPECSILHWSDSGKFLVITDEKLLMEQVVSRLWKQKDYASFARQLNIYGFKRHNPLRAREDAETFPDNYKVWKHEYLHRDSPQKDLQKVRRRAGTKKSPPSNRSKESPASLDTRRRSARRLTTQLPLDTNTDSSISSVIPTTGSTTQSSQSVPVPSPSLHSGFPHIPFDSSPAWWPLSSSPPESPPLHTQAAQPTFWQSTTVPLSHHDWECAYEEQYQTSPPCLPPTLAPSTIFTSNFTNPLLATSDPASPEYIVDTPPTNQPWNSPNLHQQYQGPPESPPFDFHSTYQSPTSSSSNGISPSSLNSPPNSSFSHTNGGQPVQLHPDNNCVPQFQSSFLLDQQHYHSGPLPQNYGQGAPYVLVGGF